MKNAQEIGWKLAVGVAAAVALSVGASAQRTFGRPAQELIRGSLENDIRDQRLRLEFRVQARPGTDPLALIPLAQDMTKKLRLAGGTPGKMAVIHLAPLARRPVERDTGFLGGALISGFFGEDGSFVVELPPTLEVGGLAAQGAQIEGRLVTVVVDLEEALEAAFVSWTILGDVANPQHAAGSGNRTNLRRPTHSSGHAGQSAGVTGRMVTVTVDLSEEELAPGPATSWSVIGSVADPVHAAGGGDRIDLQRTPPGRPRRPVIGHGHSGQR